MERTAGRICTWQEYRRAEDEHGLGIAMRGHENTGRPVGDGSSVKGLSALLGGDLLPEKPGPRREPER